MHKPLLMAAMAAAIATAPSAHAQYKPLEGDPEILNVGIISTESTQTLKDQWLPFLADMEKQVGMTIKPFFAPDYAGVIEGMRFGKVHVAWFGNKSGMEAVDRAGAEVFAQQAKTGGRQGYHSHIITHVDNKHIDSLKDLFATCGKRSLNFGIGDPNSTSGFLVPSYYVFAQNEVDPKKCFKTVRNANHETNLMAVANKQVHAAANNSEQLIRSAKKAPKARKNIKVIWTSPLIPGDPMVYRRDLSKDLKAKIKGFFLSYGRIGTPEEVKKAKATLAEMSSGLAPFTDSTNAQLYPIRQLALFRDKLKIQRDTRMDEARKAKKLKEIDDRLAELELFAAKTM